jgi:EmrB/QacA subfamily drug resistance transporter
VASSAKPIAADRLDARLWGVIVVVILGSVMAAFDSTMVNVALPSISRDLHSKLSDVQWTVSAYLLALAAVIPITGWAGRRFGGKRLYMMSLVLFTVGSALCGLAGSTIALVVFRVVQGIGGGMIQPLGQIALITEAGPRRLTKAMAAWGMLVMVAPILGPILGGVLVDSASWRWIFYINIPVCLVAVVSAQRYLPSAPRSDTGRFDLAGLVLAAIGLVSLTYGLAEAGASADTLTRVAIPTAAGSLLVGAFVVRALRVKDPLLDMRLFANKAFTAASVTTFGLGVTIFGGLVLLPLYFETVRHQDALHTGIMLGPRGLGSIAAMWMSTRLIARIGAGFTAAAGGVISLVSAVPLLFIGAQTSFVVLGVITLFNGFGLGTAGMPAISAAYRTLTPRQVNDAAPQQNIIMRLAGSIGTAVLIVILQRRLVHAGGSSAAQGAAFGSTFGWLLVFTVVGVLPTLFLIYTERRGGASEALAVENAPLSRVPATEEAYGR